MFFSIFCAKKFNTKCNSRFVFAALVCFVTNLLGVDICGFCSWQRLGKVLALLPYWQWTFANKETNQLVPVIVAAILVAVIILPRSSVSVRFAILSAAVLENVSKRRHSSVKPYHIFVMTQQTLRLGFICLPFLWPLAYTELWPRPTARTRAQGKILVAVVRQIKSKIYQLIQNVARNLGWAVVSLEILRIAWKKVSKGNILPNISCIWWDDKIWHI